MKEKLFAYKINNNVSKLVCTSSVFEENNMLSLLKEINDLGDNGIYWIFRQFDNRPQEATCIIDCAHKRIYYHHSGDVEGIEQMIERLSQRT